MSTIKYKAAEFAAQTDVHGIKHAVDPRISAARRVLWLVALLASVSCFIYIAISRVVDVLHLHPYMTMVSAHLDDIPVPRIHVCVHAREFLPAAVSKEPRAMQPRFTVPDIVYYLTYARGVPNLLIHHEKNSDHQAEIVSINQKAMENILRTNITSQDDAIYARMIASLMTMPLNQTWHFGKGLKQFTSMFQGDFVTFCEVSIDSFYKNCTDEGISHIALLDPKNLFFCHEITFSNISFSFGKQEKLPLTNQINLYLASKYSTYIVALSEMFDVAVGKYKSILFADLFSNVTSLKLIIQSRYKSTRLGRPYHEDTCVEHPRYSVCMHQCVVSDSNCSTTFPDQLYEDKVDICYKITELLIDTCRQLCPKSCTTTSIQMQAIKNTPEKPSAFAIGLTAPQEVLTHEIIEQPKYGTFEVIAELGGLLGLFLGASLLTLYHMIEHTFICVYDRVKASLNTQ